VSITSESNIDTVETTRRPATTIELPRWATRPAVVLSLILLAVAAVYVRRMADWFNSDDLLLLRAARVVPFPDYVREAFDFRDFEPLRLYAYRPLYFISSAALYRTFGLNPVPYHATVLALHLVNVVVLWWIAARLTRSDWIAYGAATIFGLHPVYSESVAWISGLNAVAATTGQLVCIATLTLHNEQRRPGWLAAGLASYGVALLFHQEIFVAPIVFLVYLALTQARRPADLLKTTTVTPFLLFGAFLLVFLVVQGWNSQESGFIDQFAPTINSLRLACGVLAISVYPAAQGGAVGASDALLMVIVLAGVAGAAWARPKFRILLAFIGAWFYGSLLLPILFFDDLPASIMKEAIARKVYAAGPALAIGMALTVAVLWEPCARRLPSVLVLAPPAIVFVAGLAFSIARTDRELTALRDISADTEAFYNDLRHEYPSLPSGTVVYTAGAPPTLLYWECAGRGTADGAGIDRKGICYLTNLVATMYGEGVDAVPIRKEEAQDPAFRARLAPSERVFCYRCDD
jgi:hypothetical protein